MVALHLNVSFSCELPGCFFGLPNNRTDHKETLSAGEYYPHESLNQYEMLPRNHTHYKDTNILLFYASIRYAFVDLVQWLPDGYIQCT